EIIKRKLFPNETKLYAKPQGMTAWKLFKIGVTEFRINSGFSPIYSSCGYLHRKGII
ncbi:hypothetical protein KIL84_006813, partial [Mauremys mutica]